MNSSSSSSSVNRQEMIVNIYIINESQAINICVLNDCLSEGHSQHFFEISRIWKNNRGHLLFVIKFSYLLLQFFKLLSIKTDVFKNYESIDWKDICCRNFRLHMIYYIYK